ncbi:MAG: type IV pilus modification protein PilV [Gammaproteobacteria bacterium]
MAKVKTIHLPANGFTMVELLVAVLVLSVGLLGLAGLQAAGLRNNQSAYLRSQATILAYDVTDRMRANRAVADAGAYNIALGAGSSGGSVAADDLMEWKNNIAAVLPAGDGSVTNNGGTFTILVQWDDNRDTSDLQQFSVEFQL